MQVIIEGQYELTSTYAKRWALPGTFPRRYWDVITYEDDDELTAYLAGQQPLIKPEAEAEPVHVCARCKKPCKPPYKHCYRCNSYLKVKGKLEA